MNEKTQNALMALAEKLGTTTEYLWKVLLTQAKHDAIASIIQIAVMFAFIYWTVKLHIRFSKEDYSGRSKYYYKGEPLIIPMVFSALLCVIFIIFISACLSDIIAAIFNPEYWALHQILKAI